MVNTWQGLSSVSWVRIRTIIDLVEEMAYIPCVSLTQVSMVVVNRIALFSHSKHIQHI